MTFWFTLLLCAHSLAHDTVLTEVAVGASSSSLWLECTGLSVPVSCLSIKKQNPVNYAATEDLRYCKWWSWYMQLVNTLEVSFSLSLYFTERRVNSYCGVQKLIMPRVISKTKKVNTALKSPYTQKVRLERRAMAMSMAHYRRGSHCRGRILERGLTLTWLEGW